MITTRLVPFATLLIWVPALSLGFNKAIAKVPDNGDAGLGLFVFLVAMVAVNLIVSFVSLARFAPRLMMIQSLVLAVGTVSVAYSLIGAAGWGSSIWFVPALLIAQAPVIGSFFPPKGSRTATEV